MQVYQETPLLLLSAIGGFARDANSEVLSESCEAISTKLPP